jgi:ABC-type oligopeptide transport system substrate-binding subunit
MEIIKMINVMKALVLAFAVLALSACSGDGEETSEGAGSTEVFVNGNGNNLNFIDNDIQFDGEGNTANIDQLNGGPEEETPPALSNCSEISEANGICTPIDDEEE